jgi:hypothetical protein
LGQFGWAEAADVTLRVRMIGYGAAHQAGRHFGYDVTAMKRDPVFITTSIFWNALGAGTFFCVFFFTR